MHVLHTSFIVAALATGCSSSRGADIDLSTPVAAARCQTEAIRTKSSELWYQCLHPDAFADLSLSKFKQSARKVGYWEEMAKKNVPLATVRDSDFVLEPSPDARYADKVAKFPLDGDYFELWRKNGRWYIVDIGL